MVSNYRESESTTFNFEGKSATLDWIDEMIDKMKEISPCNCTNWLKSSLVHKKVINNLNRLITQGCGIDGR